MTMERRDLAGADVFVFPKLEAIGGVRHAVTTRWMNSGGERSPCNLSDRTGPDPHLSVDNRRRLCGALGFSRAEPVWGRQVHRDRIAVLSHPDGAHPDRLGETDGLVTDMPDLPLMAMSADCPLIALVDPLTPAVGVVHAGWRGTIVRIAQRGAESMAKSFCSPLESMMAFISPSAGPCCYEIGSEVVDAAEREFGGSAGVVRRGRQTYLDLWRANFGQLVDAGLRPANIVISGLCTMCRVDTFYSHRKEGDAAGRFGFLIGIGGG
jgi:hypothetical protein